MRAEALYCAPTTVSDCIACLRLMTHSERLRRNLMKRHLIVLAAAAFVAVVSFVAPSTAAAQSGFMIGYTTSNFSFTPNPTAGFAVTPTTTRGSGFLLGVALHESDKRPLELSVEGFITTKAATFAPGEQLRLTYIASNVFARSGFRINRALTGHVYAGPELGYLVHSSFGGTSLSSTGASISNGDIGLTFGGGVNWDGRVLDVRYTVGLNSLTSVGAFGPGVTAKDHTLSIVFGVGR